ncbi:unnamed protein product [Cylicocyclus nassatus]|uniref:Uncharacterized protein n=1 Tax=Cylicocyclus nassatus TaxID=53992 RepID=A0AA36MBZ3_CYLNA|nr:unnamed protein product [Cylicocyclus nassatus]
MSEPDCECLHRYGTALNRRRHGTAMQLQSGVIRNLDTVSIRQETRETGPLPPHIRLSRRRRANMPDGAKRLSKFSSLRKFHSDFVSWSNS